NRHAYQHGDVDADSLAIDDAVADRHADRNPNHDKHADVDAFGVSKRDADLECLTLGIGDADNDSDSYQVADDHRVALAHSNEYGDRDLHAYGLLHPN